MTPDKFYYAVALICLAIAEENSELNNADVNRMAYLIGYFRKNNEKINDEILKALDKMFRKYKDRIERIAVREETF